MRRHRRSIALALLVLAAGLVSGSCTLFAPVELPAGYAVVYGVNSYASISNVAYADNDADAIAALLAGQGFKVYSRTNSDATMANFKADMAAVAAEAPADSRFVFYFADHGYGDGRAEYYTGYPDAWFEYMESASNEPTARGAYPEYLFLHDMPAPSSLTTLEAVGTALEDQIGDDYLSLKLSEIPARMKVVIIDACHSGGFRGDGTSVDTIPETYEGYYDGLSIADRLAAVTLYLDFSAPTADVSETEAIVMSAAGEQEFSYGSNVYSQGIFTHYLLESATVGDHNYDGYVTVSEAHAYARESIEAVDNEYLSGEAKFIPRISGGAVDFVLFKVP
jgi:uncharacterized caspase-like protein